MDSAFEARYHALERTQWWSVGRRDALEVLLKSHDRACRVLEVGCSSGVFLQILEKAGFRKALGTDISLSILGACAQANLTRVSVMDGSTMGFRDEQFDVVVASDVLEHIQDDRVALAEWRRVLRPGGTLIVFVPAFAFLWGEHDEANHHRRRYTRGQLASRLEATGFQVGRSSYWNFSLFFPAALVRTIQRVFPGLRSEKVEQLHALSPSFNSLLAKLLKIENAALSRFDLPVGISAFAVAIRR